ncbi:unnamed protein product, partial [Rotaria socialis]
YAHTSKPPHHGAPPVRTRCHARRKSAHRPQETAPPNVRLRRTDTPSPPPAGLAQPSADPCRHRI